MNAVCQNPHDRDRLFVVYEQLLQVLGKPYTIIRGAEDERISAALRALSSRAIP
jgi:hypothetical protein